MYVLEMIKIVCFKNRRDVNRVGVFYSLASIPYLSRIIVQVTRDRNLLENTAPEP